MKLVYIFIFNIIFQAKFYLVKIYFRINGFFLWYYRFNYNQYTIKGEKSKYIVRNRS